VAKYHNRYVVDDGIRFDSLMEHRRYQELKLLIKAGVIMDLHVHPKFMLQEKYFSHSQRKNIQAITYTGDFSYLENGKIVVEDVKGIKTAVFNLKRRIFEYYFPNILFRVVEKV
jgi:hypothetical protein